MVSPSPVRFWREELIGGVYNAPNLILAVCSRGISKLRATRISPDQAERGAIGWENNPTNLSNSKTPGREGTYDGKNCRDERTPA
jgi:hypothetical protein